LRNHQGRSGIESLSLILATALVVIVAASLVVSFLPRASAASHTVDIRNSAFNPSSTTIAPGDSVTWTNNDGLTHTVTGTGWGSGNLAAGATYTHQFNTTGDFAYHCTIHSFMTGTVHVSSASPPPTTTPSKPLLSGMTLIVVIAVAIVVVVAVVVVLMRRKPAKKA
jgi:plastocyanin